MLKLSFGGNHSLREQLSFKSDKNFLVMSLLCNEYNDSCLNVRVNTGTCWVGLAGQTALVTLPTLTDTQFSALSPERCWSPAPHNLSAIVASKARSISILCAGCRTSSGTTLVTDVLCSATDTDHDQCTDQSQVCSGSPQSLSLSLSFLTVSLKQGK